MFWAFKEAARKEDEEKKYLKINEKVNWKVN